jgi:hypothetical protein
MRLARRLASFLPLGLAVIAVNYLVDPGRLFGRGDVEGRIAGELLAGRSVVAGFRMDELRLRQRLAEGRSRGPDVLVLGSSRAMPLAGDAFPGREVVNASVSSASIEDAIALLELYEGHGLRPRTLFLPVEPWALNGSLRNPSAALESELRAGLRRLGRRSASDDGSLSAVVGVRSRWLQLVSPAYFQASLASVLARGRWGTGPDVGGRGQGRPGESAAAAHRFNPDGSVEWEPAMAARTSADVEALARASAARAPRYLEPPPVRERLLLLRAFLDDVARRGMHVVLWLPPFHPAAYQSFVAGRRGRALSEGESDVRTLAAAAGVPLLGSYDPARCRVSAADFVDYNHLRREAANALVARLMAESEADR